MIYEDLAMGVRKYKTSTEKAASLINEIEELLSGKNNISWQPSKILKGTPESAEYVVDTEFRYNVFFWLNPEHPHEKYSEETKRKMWELDSSIKQTTQECLKQYLDENGVTLSFQEPFELLKYTENNHLSWHTDDGSSNRSRVSLLYYLNDEYSGGELEFKNLNLTYRPKAGDLLIFPSSFIYRHRVHKVTDGTRYVIVDFMG